MVPTAVSAGQDPDLGEPNTRLHGRLLWLARAAWLGVFLLILSMVIVNIPHLYLDTRRVWQFGESLLAALSIFPSITAFVNYVVTLKLIAVTIFAGTAVFLAWRRSDDYMVLFTSATLLLLIYLFGFNLDVDTIRYPAYLEQSLPISRMIIPTLMFGSLIGLFFLFPNGRFYPRWIALVAVLAFLLVGSVFYESFNPNFNLSIPFLDAFPADWGWWIFFYSFLGALLIGLISRILYYHRVASVTQRRQIKLVLFGLGAIILMPILSLIIGILGLGPQCVAGSQCASIESWQRFLGLTFESLLPVILPITIGMSVLRYRLWEVDLLINRTLVYGLLTAVVLLFYGLVVGFAGVFLPSAIDWFVPILGLALVILAARPLRDLLQEWADRLLPVQSASGQTEESQDVVRSWPMVILQGLWLALILLFAWQIAQRLLDFNSLLFRIQQEWIVNEVTRGMSNVSAPDLGRLIVYSELSTLLFSWLMAIFVFWRRRHMWMGLYVAYILLIMPFSPSFGTFGAPIWPGIEFFGIGLAILFLFIFPNGRFVPHSWSKRVSLAVFLTVLLPITFGLAQLIWPDVNNDERAYFSVMFTLTGIMIAGISSQIYRYHRLSDAVQRRQTRWVLIGLSMRVAWLAFAMLWISLGPSPEERTQSVMALATILLSLAASIALPLSIAVAIVYDRLWQMDLVLNRTLVFGGLTGLVVILYVIVVGVLGTIFQAVNNLFLSVVATGLIAILFNPLRQRLQRGVNRLLYGQRDDPMTVMAELGKRLENSAVPGDILPDLVDTIAQTLKLPYVAITGTQYEIIAESGMVRPIGLQQYAMMYQAQPVGHLQVAQRAAGEKFTIDEERLLRNVARQAGTAVYAFQLTNQLQRSRERLVTTREEERRRLRRDLHDGLGPQLATIAVKVSAAQNLLEADPAGAERLLGEIKVESQSAIREIRRVVEDLRPSAVDQLGLLSALHEFVVQNGNGQVKITLAAPDQLPALPAAVEVAVFRTVTEAVTNIIRHANAQNCLITLSLDKNLVLQIVDDGDGFSTAVASPGIGLNSMQERAAELGGTFEVESTVGKGTKIMVTIPMMAANE